MSSFVVSLWSEKKNIAVVSTDDESFVSKLRKWAKENGLKVEIVKHKVERHGTHHQ